MRLPFLVLLAAAATPLGTAPASAQEPFAPNNPSTTAELAAPGVASLAATADTTSPEQYYPLAVGNEWEYEFDGGHALESIVGDTTALGRRYFVIDKRSTLAPNRASRTFVRYDTASATVRELLVRTEGPPVELGFYAPCPLDAPFGATITCEEGQNVTSGGYASALVFGDDGRAGVGRDTLRTAVKGYLNQAGFETRFAAGVGVVLNKGEGSFEALSYYRVGGETRGVRRFGVPAEPGPATVPRAALRVWPNPTAGSVTLRLAVPAGGAVEWRAFDALGRLVWQRDEVQAVGEATLTLDTSGWPSGLYVVRAATASGAATATVVRR